MFTCEKDSADLATSCCVCAFPLPCLCEACVINHCTKPGNHRLLPLSAKEHIGSEREFFQLQRRLNQFDVTYEELKRVCTTFQRARKRVESSSQEIIHHVTETKNKYLAQLDRAVLEYTQRLETAMKESYANVWRGSEYQPRDPFTRLIWEHEPGQGDSLDLKYRVSID